MSLVIAAPKLVAAAAGDVAGIGSTPDAADAAAEAPTTGILAAGGWVLLAASSWHSAKVIENTAFGPGVMHGQWFWMNAPEIHSSTWEWDG
jgi:hypothetical protein